MGTSGGVSGGAGSLPPLAFTAGTRWAPLSPGATASNAALGIGTARVAPVYLPACTIAAVGAEITAVGDVGSLYRLGIWKDNGNGAPGAVELDAGTIAADSATAQEIAVAHTFTAGWYHLGGVIQNDVTVQPTVRCIVANLIPDGFPFPLATALPAAGAIVTGYSMPGVAGALPAWVGSNVSSIPAPRLWFRF